MQTIEERTFGFRVPRPLFEKAEERAEAEMLSVSAYLRRLIKQDIERDSAAR